MTLNRRSFMGSVFGALVAGVAAMLPVRSKVFEQPTWKIEGGELVTYEYEFKDMRAMVESAKRSVVKPDVLVMTPEQYARITGTPPPD